MNKSLTILTIFAALLLSCTEHDEDENSFSSEADGPEKMSVRYAALPKITNLDPKLNYEFSYNQGNLTKISGKIKTFAGFDVFLIEPNSILSYNNNLVTVENSEIADNNIKRIIYTMEKGRPKKAELYDGNNLLFSKKDYFYEADKIVVSEKMYTWEFYTTYFFDSHKNLIKAEKLEKSGGIDKKLTTTMYLDFDHSKNPYKKLYLANDNFYEKSLSENNYRKIAYTVKDLQNTQFPPGYGNAEWTYSYNSDGQIILYFQ
ncbi:hypothetical protein FY557_17865 [Chryseobacterium sp. SN22]|uniref:hypothetical protein n=1 Tax=Chryseobacterium sp. SN22 TaxID=2606431 RepID=UPI0011EF2C38|nr:hypothetical protein [Chryseobacterium sp. SN22]KAA0126385.1 hypothetical protein FY557_17865 [Chryseobacterium sp. SN22]